MGMRMHPFTYLVVDGIELHLGYLWRYACIPFTYLVEEGRELQVESARFELALVYGKVVGQTVMPVLHLELKRTQLINLA